MSEKKILYMDDPEWIELVNLEYVLTWGYSDNIGRDSKRHAELAERRWVGNIHVSHFFKELGVPEY